MTSSNITEREKLKIRADVASRIARYDESLNAVKLMAQRVSPSKPLTEEERNLLSVAYKNCVGGRRAGWRNVCKIERMENDDNNVRRMEIARAYRKTIEGELVGLCKELLQLLDKRLIVKTMEDDEAVFYYKMKGDYARYIAEVSSDNQTIVNNHVNIADLAYKEAHSRAETGLSDTHPLRLGLALNYSVFLHEMKADHVTAIEVAKTRYDEALDELDGVNVVDQGRFAECRNLLTLLHENLKIWTGRS